MLSSTQSPRKSPNSLVSGNGFEKRSNGAFLFILTTSKKKNGEPASAQNDGNRFISFGLQIRSLCSVLPIGIVTLLVLNISGIWRYSISRGGILATSIGKYEKRALNFAIQGFSSLFYFSKVTVINSKHRRSSLVKVALKFPSLFAWN